MKKPAVADQPTVTRRDAHIFFNMGYNKFLRRWDEYFKHHIGHVETNNGVRLLLVDVVAVAFPEASDHTIHEIAYQHLLYLHEKRVSENGKDIKEKDEGDS